jgi:soluble P-type ATPase
LRQEEDCCGPAWPCHRAIAALLEIEIPGHRRLRLEHLVLDVNGTLALDGRLIPGVAERLRGTSRELSVHLLTANTHGRQSEIDAVLGLTGVVLKSGQPEAEQKSAFVRGLGAGGVCAIGNGANDAAMLESAALAIAVLGPEGLAADAMRNADLIAADINQALDLLLKPSRLVATLRR